MATENRETFMARLRPYHSPATMLEIELAYTLAKFGHRAQVRKELDAEGKPLRYFEHLRRVALTLVDEVEIVDHQMVITALLHDGPEDTRDLTPEMIEHCFGPDVTKLVQLLTKDPKEGYLDRIRLMKDWRLPVIKLCDRLDNVRSLTQASPTFQQKQVKETFDVYIPFFIEMGRLVPELHKHRYDDVLWILSNEVTRVKENFRPVAQ